MLNHVIMADLPLHTIAENNLLPNGCAKAFRREALEDVESADNTDGSGGVNSSSINSIVVLVKTAAAVIVNKLIIPLIVSIFYFVSKT